MGLALLAVLGVVAIRLAGAQAVDNYPKGSLAGKNLWVMPPTGWEATNHPPDKLESESGESGALEMHPSGSNEWFVVFDGIFLARGSVPAAREAVDGWRQRAAAGGDSILGGVKEEHLLDRTLIYIEYRQDSLGPKGVQRDGVIVLPDGMSVRFNEGLLDRGSLVGPETQAIVKSVTLIAR